MPTKTPQRTPLGETATNHKASALDPEDVVAMGEQAGAQPALASLRGSGRGLWGDDSTSVVAAMRDDWE